MAAKVDETRRKDTPKRLRKPKAGDSSKAAPRRAAANRLQIVEDQSSEIQAIRATSERLSGQFGVGDFRADDLIDTAKDVFTKVLQQPGPMVQAGLGLIGELLKVAAGQSLLAPVSGDKRFTDPAWQQSAFYKGWMQFYLAWSQSLQQYAAECSHDSHESARVAFFMSQLADALAPSNNLLGNPQALKKSLETGGASLLRGMSNLLSDAREGRFIPSQSDNRPFKVGENLACTPGAVVLRTEMFELLQYAPQTPTVHERPMLFIPPIVNKYYIFDLAPGRSLVEHFVKSGMTVFLVAWRNPSRKHDDWGAPEYVESIDAAIDAVREISGADDVNLWGVCGAAPAVVSLLAYYVATQQHKVNSLVLMVPLLDMGALSNAEGIGGFVDQKGAPTATARRRKRISAREFSLLFGLMRSNDLIWSYWVNNYLLGNDPPVFDVLTWNNDGSAMTAKFAEDFAALVNQNPLLERGRAHVRGTPIAGIDELGIDCYVVGAATDHICRWPGVYRAALMLGGRCQFVLGASGHIQTLVCPPDNPKASYYTNVGKPATAEQWLTSAEKHAGSWWDHCRAWMSERAGNRVDAPEQPGSTHHAPVGSAPGLYVHEKD
ncbi:alpha/beta fold hydrolase [Cupriavidus pinatubonensis]|uniref:alpha/beta fold hydrolase n=1 Tax=Cupriavidus pinatubonensis TaxID=248026 RepID=UPI00112D16BC|nr:alpha/beta fold hydrolase [Cupriavidus pinatubonensis]TPQ33973.1 class II poly(R)-hydroxyalkanoic acid synthase [Cupriavidus pinatubonensis]